MCEGGCGEELNEGTAKLNRLGGGGKGGEEKRKGKQWLGCKINEKLINNNRGT